MDWYARVSIAGKGLRYPSDMNGPGMLLTAPFIPSARVGPLCTTDMREVVNALLYIAAERCRGRMLPKLLCAELSYGSRYFYACANTELLMRSTWCWL